jgi:PKD repeat protein
LCTGSVAYDWNFGDGSAHSSQQNASHTYVTAGPFTWTMTASVSGTTCPRTGTITVHGPVPGPTVDYVWKGGSPYKLKVAGTNFDPGIQVFIGTDTSPWSNVVFKDSTYLLLKGGGSLKARFPVGVGVPIRFVNPDGQQATFVYTR